ncbi:MAG: RNA pseudouridine synthase [Kangiellaceae bacterium]|nr:RNA pseudouridine synthase [Kangiellaceae bacterium]MCW9016737.1 RNA pseudouridine synthase [Kangiellaceae bacterium]
MVRFQKSILINQEEQALIDCLAINLPGISKRKIKDALKFGAVWLTRRAKTKRIRRAKQLVVKGDELHIYYDESILFGDIIGANLIADEGDYSVWDKPCGMFSQGSKWGDHTAICRWIELFGYAEFNLPVRPAILVHRLDRATRGLILVVHNKDAAKQFTAMFESRQLDKFYCATVDGEFPESIVEIDLPIEEKAAVTRLVTRKFLPDVNQSQLVLKLETGRKHQIRKHLASVGFPIIGDRLYGNEQEAAELDDLQLCSFRLKFNCPVSGKLRDYQILK